MTLSQALDNFIRALVNFTLFEWVVIVILIAVFFLLLKLNAVTKQQSENIRITCIHILDRLMGRDYDPFRLTLNCDHGQRKINYETNTTFIINTCSGWLRRDSV